MKCQYLDVVIINMLIIKLAKVLFGNIIINKYFKIVINS
jgi:hypothetical protein